MKFVVAAMLAFAALVSAAADQKSEKHAFRIVKVVEGLEYPWCIAWLPDGRMLVTEKPGRLRIVSKDFKLDPKAIDGLPPVAYRGQGGLFDVAVHPKYGENGWIYIS